MAWRPDTYLAFAGHRTRPAHELIARVPLGETRLIYDLGCGPGNSTAALAERWPQARLIGVDNSPEMIAAARREGPRAAEWQLADVASWAPAEPPDLLFSNATFQWVAGQEEVLPRLFEGLRKGAVFAFQVPANLGEAHHRLIDEALKECGFQNRISPAAYPRHVLTREDYYRLLVPWAAHLDIWDTDYLQVLEGDDPVLAWIKGTALVPIREALGEPDFARLLARLTPKLAAHYPPESDGRTLFAFRRRFIVATRV